jgi:hypothetical protein
MTALTQEVNDVDSHQNWTLLIAAADFLKQNIDIHQ